MAMVRKAKFFRLEATCSKFAIVLALSLCAPQRSWATGGQFGLEFAIDAPWRLEPVPLQGGDLTYGPIPITIAFHDAVFEVARGYFASRVFERIPVGKLVEVRVVEWTADDVLPRQPVTVIRPADVREIERRVLVSTKTREPPAEVCRPVPGRDCADFLDITRTHDWEAAVWYTPKTPVTPGRNVHLEVTVVTEVPVLGPISVRKEWRNSLVVHAGEAPLPRFSDTWLYGGFESEFPMRGPPVGQSIN